MKDNETVKGNVPAQRADNKEITPPHIRQNNAHCGHVEEYSDDSPTTPTEGHHDASQSNAQNYLRRKFGNFSVQWLPLGEVAEFRRGSFPQPYGNKDWYDGEGCMPFVQVADISDDMRLVENTNRKISKLAQPMSIFAPKGSIIISLQGSIGRIAITQYDAYIDRTIAIFKNIKQGVLYKYFVYQLQKVFEIKEKTARGSTIKTITKEEFSNFIIPIPPLEVQEEVVRILDKFTSLLAELKAELKARKLQYEYYRDQLLSFGTDDDPNVQWLPLGEVCEIKRGKRLTKSQVTKNGLYPVISGGVTPMGFFDNFNREENTITIAQYGTAGFVNWQTSKFWANDVCYSLFCKDIIDNKYLYYYLKNAHNKIDKMVVYEATPYHLPQSKLQQLPIPIPPIAEQERIVGILDKFDKLTNSLTEGIPKEIEMRQLQYEYYRDALLSF